MTIAQDPPTTLRVGSLTGLHTFRPWQARDNVSSLLLSQVFETLYALAATGDAPEASLAGGRLHRRDDLETPNEVIYEAAVRPGVTFSDGTPMTARHVTTALSRVGSLSDLLRLEARDDLVRFHLEKANPSLALALTMIDTGVAMEKGDEILGTGPYRIAPGSTAKAPRLVLNPGYPRRPAFEEVELRVYPPDEDGSPTALLEALAAGEVDYTDALSKDEAVSVSGMRKSFQSGNSTAILFFNTERLQDPALRRALSAAVNRRELTAVSHQSVVAFEATSLLPPMSGFIGERQIFDLERAQQMLAALPSPPSRLELVAMTTRRPYLPDPAQVAEVIARQIGELGIEVEIVRTSNSDEYFQRQAQGDFDLMLGGWVAETPDPADFLEATLGSDRVPSADLTSIACFNLSRFQSNAIDEAISRFRDNPREFNLERVLKLVDQEAPLVPLMYGSTVVLSSWRVSNVQVSRMGFPDFSHFQLA